MDQMEGYCILLVNKFLFLFIWLKNNEKERKHGAVTQKPRILTKNLEHRKQGQRHRHLRKSGTVGKNLKGDC